VSSNIIKTMEEREWIRVVGYRDVPGKPALFGTTRAFLDYFNLKSLDQLPPLSEIRDMEDPQLRFEPDPLPARIVRDLPIDPDDAAQDENSVADGEEPAASDSDTTEMEHPASADSADTDDSNITADTEMPATNPESGNADASPPAETPTTTADEAANPAADVETDAAEQDTEEYRA
jgi:segregation and condensation protein B